MARFFDYDDSWDSLLKPCRAPFFDGWQPATEAALCAELSRLAYCQGADVSDALSSVSLKLVGEISETKGTGTYGFVARRADLAVVAFRGTEPDDPRDIADDAEIVLVDWLAGGKVHHGFAGALLRVRSQFEDLVRDLQQPVVITGHSLGAALATLAASLVPTSRLVTFGSPRVGNADFCAILSQSVMADRYVNCCDKVTRVPPPLEYQHFGRLRYIDRDGALLKEPPSESMMLADQATGEAEYAFRHLLLPDRVPTRSLADHSPINYVSVLVRAT